MAAFLIAHFIAFLKYFERLPAFVV